MPSDHRRQRDRAPDARPPAGPASQSGARWRRLGGLAVTIAIGALAGWLCLALGVPLPWMVGPLLATAAQSVWRGSAYVPMSFRWVGQMVIASAVATNLTPETLTAVAANIWLMLISALLIIPTSFGLAAVAMRASGVDRATALFASLPGGPVEMATLATQAGGAGALVAFAQTLRIAGIVTVVPPLLILFGAHFDDVLRGAPGPVDWPGLALVLGVGLVGCLALKRIGGANAFFLGPLFAVGALTMVMAPVTPIPGWIIAVAQIGLGLTLGRMFDRDLVLRARSFVLSAAAISGILIALSVGLAGLFTLVGDSSFQLYVLGNVPGSIAEMAVAAKGLHLDASLVTAFHMTRILIIIPFAAAFYRAFIGLTDWIDARKGSG